jgi:NADH:ubiquinone oxidoreductase subunit K
MFGLGIYTVAAHKNLIRTLLGMVMIFTASLINFAAFSNFGGFNPDGQINIFLISAACFLELFTCAFLSYRHFKNRKSFALN